jgi:hypothetical protein
MVTADYAPPSAIERQIATEYARDTVAKALFEVIIDSLEYGPRDLRTSADREWIRGAIAIPIQEATEVALHVLAWRLSQTLDRAPKGLARRYEATDEVDEVVWA